MVMRALLFDAGDVLYYRPRRWKRTQDFLTGIDLPYIDSNDPRRLALKQKAHAGHLTEREYYDALLTLFGIQDPSDCRIGRDILHQEERDVEFFEGVTDTLYRLKDLGYLLGVVTNTYISTEEKKRWFRHVSIGEIWDSFATSCELGWNKPDPRIYLAALEPLSCHPEEASFVGHTSRDLDGAKWLGMRTIAFNRDDETVSADLVIERFSELADL